MMILLGSGASQLEHIHISIDSLAYGARQINENNYEYRHIHNNNDTNQICTSMATKQVLFFEPCHMFFFIKSIHIVNFNQHIIFLPIVCE